MPIKPPNLDDRQYADILDEMMQLVPQYCPEWTNLGPADPGVTLVQLFSWMTEMVLYRVNRVPDKTYIHFLNFIGEDRKVAQPSVAPLTFSSRVDRTIEVSPYTTCATRQTEDRSAVKFLTTEPLTVHSAQIEKLVAVKGGQNPLVRDIPFRNLHDNPSVLTLNRGQGIQVFEMDPVEYSTYSYTPDQFLYVAHEDFAMMNVLPDEAGRLWVQVGEDKLSILSFFDWEYPSSSGWNPIAQMTIQDQGFGVEEKALRASFPGIVEHKFDVGGVNEQLEERIRLQRWWIRGRLNYERWVVEQMKEDLTVCWRDDRGAEDRRVNVNMQARGRSIEFEIEDLPPMKAGWLLVFQMVNRSMGAGRSEYFPKYRWYYRRGDVWEVIPESQVRMQQTNIYIEGPLTDMASEGINLRAERIETVDMARLCREFELEVQWVRGVERTLLAGEAVKTLQPLSGDDKPWDPFQINPNIPPTIGRKVFIGSDLLVNRRKERVTVEITYSFEMNGEPVEEPVDSYALQLSYRADDAWRIVNSKDKLFTKFQFNKMQDGQAPRSGVQSVVFHLDPSDHIRDIAPFELKGHTSGWLRLELTKSTLMGQDDDKNDQPIQFRIHNVELGLKGGVDVQEYEEPLLGARVLQMDYRAANERLTKIVARLAGRSYTYHPFYPFIEIDDDNQSFYVKLDKPLPVGRRHAVSFRCNGEAFLPSQVKMEWEVLEKVGKGRTGWTQLQSQDEQDFYAMNETGVLEFPLLESVKVSDEGFWMRGRFIVEGEGQLENLPSLPPIANIMLNTVNGINLNTHRTERYSGQGVPNQQIKLLRKPLFLHEHTQGNSPFGQPEKFADIRVYVDEDSGRIEWRAVTDAEILVAGKDDRVFTVDAVEGVLTFGNGIRGQMLPFGSSNVLVDVYRVVVGNKGNVAPFDIDVCDSISEVEVINLMPAIGGRNAETIDEIIERAPSLLTTRDRAVTALDFQVIAKEASSDVARAFCNGKMDEDGQVSVVILPHRQPGEEVPNPFLSEGLRDHVSRYLQTRCLINVQPIVRLASFMSIDLSLRLRLRPKANIIQTRELAQEWVIQFLDPYTGGLDGEGWVFGGTLYGQDFARMVSDLPEIRHIMDVQIFDMSDKDPRSVPGWESGSGVDELSLVGFDLFHVRRIRIQMGEW